MASVACLLLTAALACFLFTISHALPGPSGFIRVANGSFVDATCSSFLPLGWNSWVSLNREAAAIAAGLPSSMAAVQQDGGGNQVTSLFKTAQAAGFTAVRLFLHGEDSGFQLQTSQGMVFYLSMRDFHVTASHAERK
jgi:hypothetical protein